MCLLNIQFVFGFLLNNIGLFSSHFCFPPSWVTVAMVWEDGGGQGLMELSAGGKGGRECSWIYEQETFSSWVKYK